jgi:HEPN domain-containing protein
MQSHNAWISKAKNDLIGAKLLSEEKINDLAVYHTHQCAEKSLKGFLAFKLCPIQKSHDHVVLTEMCYRYDPSFEGLRSLVEALNSLGTLTRSRSRNN